jgi:hypothetical protein
MENYYHKIFNRTVEMGAIRDFPPFHFVDVGKCSKYGCWGAKEYPDQPASQAPKFRAI